MVESGEEGSRRRREEGRGRGIIRGRRRRKGFSGGRPERTKKDRTRHGGTTHTVTVFVVVVASEVGSQLLRNIEQ